MPGGGVGAAPLGVKPPPPLVLWGLSAREGPRLWGVGGRGGCFWEEPGLGKDIRCEEQRNDGVNLGCVCVCACQEPLGPRAPGSGYSK